MEIKCIDIYVRCGVSCIHTSAYIYKNLYLLRTQIVIEISFNISEAEYNFSTCAIGLE